MIKLEHLNKSYFMGDNEIPVLQDIHLNIAAGESVALIGASGSGKTTLMNLLGLLDRPDNGRYLLNGEDVSQHNADQLAALRNKKFGFIFQLFFLLPRLNALQNVMLPLTYRRMGNTEMKSLALQQLDRLGIADLSQHKPSEMSGGQQQRVAIARALIGNPDIILADEPTGALDSTTGQEVMNILRDLNTIHKKTVLIITHDPHIAEQCQRIIYMKDGKILEKQ